MKLSIFHHGTVYNTSMLRLLISHLHITDSKTSAKSRQAFLLLLKNL